MDNGKFIIWRQKINPLGVWRNSYVPIELLQNSLGISQNRFQGLIVMEKIPGHAPPTLLTGDTAKGTWWFCVGMVYKFGSHPLNDNPRILADHIKLYAIID